MLPTTVTIMGTVFTIEVLDLVTVDGVEVDGSMCEETSNIEISSKLEPHEAMSTLIHEMAHGWLKLSALTHLLDLSPEREEGLILSFERQFLPVIAKVLGTTALNPPKRVTKKAAKKKPKRSL